MGSSLQDLSAGMAPPCAGKRLLLNLRGLATVLHLPVSLIVVTNDIIGRMKFNPILRKAIMTVGFLVSAITVLGTMWARSHQAAPPTPHRIAQAESHPGEQFPTSELEIVTAADKRIKFKIEVATSILQRAQGLMFRQNLDDRSGMLFDYGVSQQATMWMKNTIIPLDMLFIDSAGKIVFIQERTVPLSETVIAAPEPVRAVLELAGGAASRLGISTGDRVDYVIFK